MNLIKWEKTKHKDAYSYSLKQLNTFQKRTLFYVLEDFLCPDAEVLLVLSEKRSAKRNGGLRNEKRILSICKRTKGKVHRKN